MVNRFFYFGISHAIERHDWIIDSTGGDEGIVNIGMLESPLEHIKNDDYYPTMEDKLNHLVFSINKHHAFQDGNKRSSLALGAYFLELNGYDFIVKSFIKQMEDISIWVADNVISKELQLEIITSILYEDEHSEHIKLQIINAAEEFELKKQQSF